MYMHFFCYQYQIDCANYVWSGHEILIHAVCIILFLYEGPLIATEINLDWGMDK